MKVHFTCLIFALIFILPTCVVRNQTLPQTVRYIRVSAENGVLPAEIAEHVNRHGYLLMKFQSIKAADK